MQEEIYRDRDESQRKHDIGNEQINLVNQEIERVEQSNQDTNEEK